MFVALLFPRTSMRTNNASVTPTVEGLDSHGGRKDDLQVVLIR
jgi:hypothetical protein